MKIVLLAVRVATVVRAAKEMAVAIVLPAVTTVITTVVLAANQATKTTTAADHSRSAAVVSLLHAVMIALLVVHSALVIEILQALPYVALFKAASH